MLEHAHVLDAIFVTSADRLFVLGPNGRVLYASARFGPALGRDLRSLIGRTPAELGLPPSFLQRLLDDLAKLAETGEPVVTELELVGADGRERRMEYILSPLRGELEGGVSMLLRDVTARHRAERALRDQERRLQTLVALVPIGIFETDAAGECLFVNDRWLELTGLDAQRAQGRGWEDAIHPDDRVRVSGEWYSAAREGREFNAEYRFLTPDGRVHWILGHAVAVRDDAGKVVGYLGTATDLTERKRHQEQMLVSDRMASVGLLAAGVAHEVNNPLAYVTANLELLEEQLKDLTVMAPELAELELLAKEAIQGAERVRKIVLGLKALSRADAERKIPLDVKAVVELSIDMAFNEIRHRARIVKELAATSPVEGDEARLGQVFVNLLVNAAHAIPEGNVAGNEIRVAMREEGGRVLVEVTDTGSGIAPEDLGRIFSPFFTTKPVGVGTGLGLSICHGIVTGLGGTIQVESVVGRGARFIVSLPALASRRPVEAAATPAFPFRPAPSGRVLVVDDDEPVARAIGRALAVEFHVTVTTEALDGLARIARGEAFDAVVCDLMMPNMNGMQFFAELGRLAPNLAERTLFVTAGAFTPAAKAFLERLPNQYVEKPVDIRQLRQLIRDRIGGTSPVLDMRPR